MAICLIILFANNGISRGKQHLYNPLNDPGNQRELVVILRFTSFWVNYNFTATEPWNRLVGGIRPNMVLFQVSELSQ